ncbi:MAG: threonine synthase [Thermodesulfobacteriota bacterium]
MDWRGVIQKYEKYLPAKYGPWVVTLLEGNTPLIRANRLAELVDGGLDIYLKVEGANPTGSFKDRGMTVAVSKAREERSRAIICASTGNTSASAAAYGARAGLAVYVVVPEGKIALGKLSQALIHGARIIQVKGNFDQALKIVRDISSKYPATLVNSLNPNRIEGQKTAAFEICDSLGGAPDYHFLPVGNAGNITAYWKGYLEYRSLNIIDRLPKMMGFQAQGAAPLVHGKVVENPETVATAIRIGNPASGREALRARDESGGIIDMVTDREIMEGYKAVASLEGIFCEPASAAGIAGLVKSYKKGLIKKGSCLVLTLTGSGLKDPDCATAVYEALPPVPATFDAVVEALKI